VLAEKPLFDALKPVPANLFSGFYIGYNMRFHPIVRKLKDLLGGERIFSATLYFGQYLPEWRPGTDYRESASARRQEGGGVLRDLSHELDMINWIFGDWVWLTAAGGRFGDLEIDSDDVFSLLIKTDRCPVASVQMSYLDRVRRREITVTTSERTYRGDLLEGVLQAQDKVDRFDVGRDDTYVAEHKAVLAGDDMSLCTVTEALKTVKMIDAAEKAARDNVWVAA
jgi:predicted dehydrogenase